MIPRLSFLGLHYIVLHIKMHIFTYESARIHTSYTESLASCNTCMIYIYINNMGCISILIIYIYIITLYTYTHIYVSIYGLYSLRKICDSLGCTVCSVTWMVAKTSATATAATPACCPVRNLGSTSGELSIWMWVKMEDLGDHRC